MIDHVHLKFIIVLLLEATKLLSCYVHLLDLQGHINFLCSHYISFAFSHTFCMYNLLPDKCHPKSGIGELNTHRVPHATHSYVTILYNAPVICNSLKRKLTQRLPWLVQGHRGRVGAEPWVSLGVWTPRGELGPYLQP